MPQERFLVYKDTLARQHPVMLVFGREGNNQGALNDVIGRYDWGLSPHAAPWNRAYGYLARISNFKSCKALKNACDARGSSFVAFANCSPTLILNSVSDKGSLRAAGRGLVGEHIKRVFELSDEHLGHRMKLAVLSVGPDFELRSEGYSAIRATCETRKVPMVEVPYFGGRLNNSAFDAQVSEQVKASLRAVMDEFVRG